MGFAQASAFSYLMELVSFSRHFASTCISECYNQPVEGFDRAVLAADQSELDSTCLLLTPLRWSRELDQGAYNIIPLQPTRSFI